MDAGLKFKMGPGEWVLLLALSLLWGGAFFCNTIAVNSLGVFTVVAGRIGLGALALWAVLRLRGEPLPARPGQWAAFYVMGLLNNLLPFSLIVWGQSHVSAGLAATLNATTPLFTVLLAHFLTRDEKLNPAKLTGALAGAAGVAILMGPGLVRGDAVSLLACGAVLAAACSYALAGIFGRRLRSASPLGNAAGQLIASASIMLPLALALERPWLGTAPPWQAWLAVAYLGFAGTALAYAIYFTVLARAGATNLLLVTLLIPVSALLLDLTLLGQVPGPAHLAGMAVIAAALLAIDGRLPAAGVRLFKGGRKGRTT